MKVREKTLRFTHTFWLGGVTLVAAVVLIATGILLMFYYHPSVPQAYRDMKELAFVVDNGLFLRNLHRWAAHLMVFSAMLHMLRVFYHRAYRPPRQFNWVIGVVLLLVTLLLSYTGYLLPWDQLAFWGVSVGTNMARDGADRRREGPLPPPRRERRLGERPPPLLRPPLRRPPGRPRPLHRRARLADPQGRRRAGSPRGDRGLRGAGGPPMTTGIPLKVTESNDPVAVPRRVALVRPDIRPAVRRREEKWVMTFPHLIVREVILFQVVVIALSLVALFVDAPLEGIANPVETPNPAKAPWYFLGLQELLHYFPPVVAGVLLPGLVVLALVVIPYARINLAAGPLWARPTPRQTPAVAAVRRRGRPPLRGLPAAGRS